MDRTLVILIAAIVMASPTYAQRPTLPEVAAKSTTNKGMAMPRIREIAPVSLEQLVAEADLIVRGRVTQTKSHLSEDQYDIYTDYEILPYEILASTGTEPGRQMPGPAALVVTRYGGRMILHGVPIEVRDTNLPPFEAGAELVLFLKRKIPGTGYTVVREMGAFAVESGHVRPLVKPPLELKKYEGLSPSDFGKAIRASHKP